MGQLMAEKDMLAKLGVKDFRSISKENIINFASMLQEMEPEVAMKALEQVPEFGRVTVAALEDYKAYAEKTLGCESAETQIFMTLCDKGIQALERCAASDDVTPEERMHYADMISEIVRNAGSSLKDSKVVNWRRFCAYSVTILAGLGIMANIIGGNVNIKLPSQKA